MKAITAKFPDLKRSQAGRVYVKVFWLTSIIISLILTLGLNLLFHLFNR